MQQVALAKLAITIDVETDWGGRLAAKPENCRGIIKGIPLILDILNECNIKSTFFISGRIADEYKDITLEIRKHGHEVASHGYDHIDYSRLDGDQMDYQLGKSKDVLEHILKGGCFSLQGDPADMYVLDNGEFSNYQGEVLLTLETDYKDYLLWDLYKKEGQNVK